MTVPTVNQGFDYSFFQKTTVSSATFGSSPDVFINFNCQVQGFSIANETASTTVQVSYNNGNVVHDELNGSSSTTAFLLYENRPVSKIWLKLTAGVSAVITVRAWAIR